MQYRVDKFLPKAFEAIKKVKIGNNTFFTSKDKPVDDGEIFKEYNGYISSLGANIVQAGVRTAITFYEAEESGSRNDRRLINAAIKYILVNNDNYIEHYDDCRLTKLLPKDEEQVQTKAMEILDAATALKLALRTYKMS